MTAAHPITPTAPSADRGQEPSMEEILASIRRIIADDQSLPSHAAREQGLRGFIAPSAAPPEPLTPVHVLRPEPQEPPKAVEPPAVAPVAESAPQAAVMPTPQVAAAPAIQSAPEAKVAVPPPAAAAPVVKQPAVKDDAPLAYDAPPDATPAEAEPVSLFSKATDHSVSSAFGMLAASRLADNSDELLGLARDMIRPMLRTWLDDNLPSMVERLVRAEIERVSRGGR